MTHHPDDRRYSDDEVRRILERATELDAGPPARRSGRGDSGLTLAELEDIAGEAGLSPETVRQAAGELGRGEGRRPPAALESLAGAPTRLLFRKEVEVEVDADDLRDLVPVIELELGPGLLRESRSGLVWHLERATASGGASGGVPRRVRVTLESRRGRTVIRIEEPLGELAGGLYGGIVGGGGVGVGIGVGLGVGLGALGSALFATLFPVAALGGAYAVARSVFTSTARKRTDELLRVSDALEAEVRRMGIDTRSERGALEPGGGEA